MDMALDGDGRLGISLFGIDNFPSPSLPMMLLLFSLVRYLVSSRYDCADGILGV